VREIEFRAWDSRNKKMVGSIPCWFVEFDGDIWFNSEEGYDTGDCLHQQHNMILMQFTGLRDKNGVKIFGRDIVKSDKGLIVEIYWCNMDAAYRCRDKNGKSHINWTLGHFIVDGLTVIGNSIENPELLESKD
jgi:hypothetical protein